MRRTEGKKLRNVPFFLRSQRNDEVGWTSWPSNRLLFSQFRMFCGYPAIPTYSRFPRGVVAVVA
jgi:hypothetical protein